MTIALLLPPHMIDAWTRRFAALAPQRKVIPWPQARGAGDVRYAFCWKAEHGALASLPALEAIISMGAGVDHILSDPYLPDRPIVRVIDPNLTMRMGEYVLLHVLLHHRRLPLYLRQQKYSVWHAHDQWAASGLRVGIMGLGELGGSVAAKLAMVGFDVAGWSRTAKQQEGIATYAGDAGLDAFLARSDVLVALLPLTPETKGMLNANLFAKLAKDGPLGAPVLINAGRGGSQVDADIIAALDAGTLAAASLDVFDPEPLPPQSPLWRHPKVIVTPHNAADSEPDAICRYVLDIISDYEDGRPLRNLVDRARGY